MSMAVLDRDEIERSLALLEKAAATDADVRAAADALKRALREADARNLLTVEEAAEALGILAISVVRRWVNIGYIHGVRRDGRALVPVSEIERIRDDERVRAQQALSKLQAECADLGGDELTEEEMEGLRATRPGKPPWER